MAKSAVSSRSTDAQLAPSTNECPDCVEATIVSGAGPATPSAATMAGTSAAVSATTCVSDASHSVPVSVAPAFGVCVMAMD